MVELTERQRETLEWIVGYIQSNWRPPTIKEIGLQFKIKTPSAADVVRALQKKGYLEEGDGSARAHRPINLAEASAACLDKRLLRLAQSSRSIAAVKGFEGSIRVSAWHGRNSHLFAVTVGDDSLYEALIFKGDTAIFRRQEQAEDGDIVAASVGFEAMIRRIYYGDDGSVVLMPENKKYDTLATSIGELTIYGRLVALYRDYD